MLNRVVEILAHVKQGILEFVITIVLLVLGLIVRIHAVCPLVVLLIRNMIFVC